MSSIDQLLEKYRSSSKSEREKGTYFERLAMAFLISDPVQSEEFEQVWTWQDWAPENGFNAKDTGIDLVAKLRNEDGFAAAQAKFYAADTRIQKSHIDSFISASGKSPFTRRVIIDTTIRDWTDNAEEMLRGQTIPVIRISLADLRESRIDWTLFDMRGETVLHEKKSLRPDQKEAVEAVVEGLRENDRGKLIMACGTGKTFISLRIAEELAGKGNRVLFMVPSLALMSQAIREWTNDTDTPLRSFSVCSDSQVGKRRRYGDDTAEIEIHDLAIPATTDARRLADKASEAVAERMTVVFSTYQSIQTLTAAHEFGLPTFDLIICDEAHRTTGATLAGDDESNFVRVHSDQHIQGKKRLYMTATPRIYGDTVKSKADEVGAELTSMDDESLFGKVLCHRSFGWAVSKGLLSDYKVIVLAMDEGLVSANVQNRLADENSELDLDDATKIIGCYKALTKQDLKSDISFDPLPMRRALAFCRSIAASKLIRDEFSAVVSEYSGETPVFEDEITSTSDQLTIEIEHVDGTDNARTRGARLDWLKEQTKGYTCRILSNARCLTEGVDVPALDAIMFLHPRKSQIDVVQSVGRVMRKADDKKMGYVILPVGVPADVEPEIALRDNEKFKVVWQILNALRAHDERFDSTINKASLGQDISDRIEIVGITPESEELNAITAEVKNLPSKKTRPASAIGSGGTGEERDREVFAPVQGELFIDEFSKAIMAKIVKRCGTRDYWEEWATNIAEIAQRHISRITGLLQNPDTSARKAFNDFMGELRDDLNDNITETDAIEMLAQHIITRPVFQTLFEGHAFTDQNPVSQAMQQVLSVLDESNIDKESTDLDKFYDSVKLRSEGITEPQAKQRLIVELYDKFFRKAFPRTTEKLGIVYTPVEIVDFILRSVNEMLQDHFGQTLGSKDVHIMDPFTGTGTFITRLLQSELIGPEEMEYKFRSEIHANEIVLLAYYIAAINIEAVYHGLSGMNDYTSFEGICLTDTFQMYESEDLISHYLPDNSERRKRQKATNIQVIVGNPPYSVGQKSANDDAANTSYLELDEKIQSTYAAHSTATNKNALYDSYIRAFRWASDRIGSSGIVAYVTNAGWVDGNATDGMRACLVEEFSDLYIFNLRGNARTSGEQRRKEKGNVFGEGSRTPVAISVLVKNPEAKERGRIFYHDIGDYLSQEEKLEITRGFESISGITDKDSWEVIVPDENNDWLTQTDKSFRKFPSIGIRDGQKELKFFEGYSRGLESARDAWIYNSSRQKLASNMKRMISSYNSEIDAGKSLPEATKDPKLIKWSSSLNSKFERGIHGEFAEGWIIESHYRPFQIQCFYSEPIFVHRYGKLRKIFPHSSASNLVIMMTGIGSKNGFSTLMSNTLPDLNLMEAGAQCFPLYLYEEAQPDDDLFTASNDQNNGFIRCDAITDDGMAHFQIAYPGEEISKEDLFYYIYGLLHSPDYRERFKNNLAKALPRIPAVRSFDDFTAFRDAGQSLGKLHVGFEKVDPYMVTFKEGNHDLIPEAQTDPVSFYRVRKMKFAGKRGDQDRTTVIYNNNITIQGVPLEAYDYVVNGKPALDWVMERQCVKTDKASGIVNDANDYANEIVGDPRYPMELFQRVITVSLEAMEIVQGLPKLDIDSSGNH